MSDATVGERVKAIEDAGLNHLMLLGHFGALDAAHVEDSLRRFAEEVAAHIQ